MCRTGFMSVRTPIEVKQKESRPNDPRVAAGVGDRNPRWIVANAKSPHIVHGSIAITGARFFLTRSWQRLIFGGLTGVHCFLGQGRRDNQAVPRWVVHCGISRCREQRRHGHLPAAGPLETAYSGARAALRPMGKGEETCLSTQNSSKASGNDASRSWRPAARTRSRSATTRG